jgi:hypothetical protein
MKLWRNFIVSSIVILLFIIPASATATSWVYPFVVWDQHIYQITDEEVTTVEKQIGKVTSYSDMGPLAGNFSNHYPKDTKYFSIQGIDPKTAIAVENTSGNYIKAINEGKYASPKQLERNIYQWLGILAIVIAVVIIINRKRKVRRF